MTDVARVRQVRPPARTGLRLLLATTLVDGEPFGLDVGVMQDGRLPVLLDRLLFCGCDACDDGSADLLSCLDGWVLTVARGGVVHARLGELWITRTINGWQGAGEPPDTWPEESSSLADGVDRWVGTPWR